MQDIQGDNREAEYEAVRGDVYQATEENEVICLHNVPAATYRLVAPKGTILHAYSLLDTSGIGGIQIYLFDSASQPIIPNATNERPVGVITIYQNIIPGVSGEAGIMPTVLSGLNLLIRGGLWVYCTDARNEISLYVSRKRGGPAHVSD